MTESDLGWQTSKPPTDADFYRIIWVRVTRARDFTPGTTVPLTLTMATPWHLPTIRSSLDAKPDPCCDKLF